MSMSSTHEHDRKDDQVKKWVCVLTKSDRDDLEIDEGQISPVAKHQMSSMTRAGMRGRYS